MSVENKDYIVAIDLGDSNIVVGVASPAEGGRINIEHILTMPSEGVSAGQIMNIDLAVKTIRTALERLRETSGIEVKEAYVGISGEFIYCTSHTDHVFVPDHKNGVTQQVVDALFERMGNVMVSEDRYIMERIPQRYVINDTTEVDNPVGVFGSPLSSTFNFISSDNIPLSRIDMALRRLNIIPRRTFSNAVVVGDAVLSPDEKEEGVVVVDLGGDLTDISIYHHNVVRYISTIPIGAKAFNNDIRSLAFPDRYIEQLKLKYGCALSKHAPQDVSVVIKGRSRHEQREIAIYNLAAVIEARARDIAELVSKEISDSGFADRVPYGIVLTGGSAQLRYLDELFREVTGLEVRVAEAEDVISPPTRTKITSSADSTVVGLLLHGLKYGPCAVEVGEPTAVVVQRPFTVHQDAATRFDNAAATTHTAAPTPQPMQQPQSIRATPTMQVATPAAPRNIYNQSPSPIGAEAGIEPKAPVSINSYPEATTPAPTPTPEIDKAVEALIGDVAPREEQVVESENPSKEEAGGQQEKVVEETKAKRRIPKLFNTLAAGVNNLVNNVNNHFDVNEEDEI